jgi:hypothetical protein
MTAFFLGAIMELTNVFHMISGLALILMSVSIIYLGFYVILFKLFKKWEGVDPYITSRTDRVGDNLIDGFWSKYPEGRKVMWSDILFSFAQALLPTFFIMGLILIVIELN